MVEITTEELALTENARALSGNPVASVSPLVNGEITLDQKLTLLVSQIPDVKLPHRPLLFEQSGNSIAFELFSALMGSPYPEYSAQQEVVLPGNMPVCLALQGLYQTSRYVIRAGDTHKTRTRIRPRTVFQEPSALRLMNLLLNSSAIARSRLGMSVKPG